MPMNFKRVKNEKQQSTNKEHNKKKCVSSSSHHVQGKRKQNRHNVNFILVYFFAPSFQDTIIFSRLCLSDYLMNKGQTNFISGSSMRNLTLTIWLLNVLFSGLEVYLVFYQPEHSEDGKD